MGNDRKANYRVPCCQKGLDAEEMIHIHIDIHILQDEEKMSPEGHGDVMPHGMDPL